MSHPRNRINLVTFRREILSSDFLDTDCHHELSGGDHGQKAHLDRISRGSSLHDALIRLKAEKIRALRPITRSLVIVGIANGTNEEAHDIADEIDDGILAIETEKVTRRSVRFTDKAVDDIRSTAPFSAVLTEDVSTKGTVCASLVSEARALGIRDILVVPTLQREAKLPYLDALNVPYDPLVYHEMPSYSAVDCAVLTEGFCNRGISLKKYGEDE